MLGPDIPAGYVRSALFGFTLLFNFFFGIKETEKWKMKVLVGRAVRYDHKFLKTMNPAPLFSQQFRSGKGSSDGFNSSCSGYWLKVKAYNTAQIAGMYAWRGVLLIRSLVSG